MTNYFDCFINLVFDRWGYSYMDLFQEIQTFYGKVRGCRPYSTSSLVSLKFPSYVLLLYITNEVRVNAHTSSPRTFQLYRNEVWQVRTYQHFI